MGSAIRAKYSLSNDRRSHCREKKGEIRFFLSGVGPKRKIKRGLNALHAYRYKLVRLDLGIFGLRVR